MRSAVSPLSSDALPLAERLLSVFAEPGPLPRRALRTAVEHWDTVSGPFLERLEAYIADPAAREEDADALFMVVHLFAEVRDPRAYRPLLRALALSEEHVDALLSGAITETLRRVAASVFDGDPEPLERTLLDPAVDPCARWSLFDTLAFLTADGRIPRERTRAFLERCDRELDRDPEYYDNAHWAGWQSAIAYLGLAELAPLVYRAFEDGRIDTIVLEPQHFEEDLANARAARERGELPPDPDQGYFRGVVEELSGWYCFSTKFLRDQERAERERKALEHGGVLASWEPHVNPLRHVGRNDPCPCGSGKKYKKCCLAA